MEPKDIIIELAEDTGFPKVSLYFPTHISGPEIQQDAIRLKNALVEARTMLHERGMESNTVATMLSRATELVEDLSFWQHQQNALALFIDLNDTRHYKLSCSVREEVVVGDSFYTLPLLKMMGTGETFHVLALNQSEARLFDASEDGMTQRPVTMTPGAMADARGASDFNDDTGSHPNARGSESGGAAGVPQVHALGTGKEEQAETELWRFLKYVKNEVSDLLADSGAPIVLVGGDRIVGHYRSLVEDQRLVDDSVQKNTASMSDDEVLEAAVEVVYDTLNAPRQEALDVIMSRMGGDSDGAAASNDANRILEAAREGRVDTVMIDFSGLDGSQSVLLNDITQATLKNGGTVLSVPRGADRNPGPISASFRY